MISFRSSRVALSVAACVCAAGLAGFADPVTNWLDRLTPDGESDLAHRTANPVTPLPWPGGRVPYDITQLTEPQKQTALKAMKRWEETGAAIYFTPRSNEVEYVFFTGRTNAGNNTSLVGYRPSTRAEINITTFWWSQGEWMPVHELGHVLGFHHEHERWDRDGFVTIHYENLKPERRSDYDWIPRTHWLVRSTAYDYYSIMHYRTCWSSVDEKVCCDGNGESPKAVIDPVGTNYDGVIGQWSTYGISPTDALKAKLAYGARPVK
jgi:hypothetical protein